MIGCMRPSWGPTCNLGMCSDWESNPQSSGMWDVASTNWTTLARAVLVFSSVTSLLSLCTVKVLLSLLLPLQGAVLERTSSKNKVTYPGFTFISVMEGIMLLFLPVTQGGCPVRLAGSLWRHDQSLHLDGSVRMEECSLLREVQALAEFQSRVRLAYRPLELGTHTILLIPQWAYLPL